MLTGMADDSRIRKLLDSSDEESVLRDWLSGRGAFWLAGSVVVVVVWTVFWGVFG